MFDVVEENKNVKTVKVSLDHESIDDARDVVYNDLSKDIKLKGFRPGMVPRNLINTIIGMDKINELVKDEVAEKAFNMLFRDGLQDSENMLLPPRVKSVELGGTADVLFEIHFFPKVEIESLKGIEIEVPDAGNIDKSVENAMNEIREEKAILVPKEEGQSAQIGDVAEIEYFDLTGKDPEKKTLEIKIGNPEEGSIFTHLVGKKIGDEFDFTSKSENTENETKLHVKVNKLYSRKLPDIDDNLAKMIDEKYETLEDLKNVLKSEFKEAADDIILSLKRDMILEKLIEKTKIDVLDSTIDYFIDYIVDNKKEDGVYDEELKDKFKGDEKAYRESIKSEAINYLKLEGATRLIAKEKSLDVSDDEVFEEAKMMYEESKISDERLKIMLKKDPSLYSTIKQKLLSFKVADELLKDAVIVVRKLNEDDELEDEKKNDEVEESESEGEN